MEFEPTEEDLLQLRQWLKKMPHLLQDYDDPFLSAIVRGCKGSLQIAKEKLENFNGLGNRYPQLYGSYDPFYPALQENLTSRLMFPLPKKTPDGSTVFFTCKNPNLTGFSKVYVPEFIRYYLLSLYVLIWENDFGSGKIIHVAYNQTASIKDINDLTPMTIKHIAVSFRNSLPFRLQAIHLFNVSSAAEYAFNVVKIFARKKIADRFFLHSQSETMKDIIPEDILPAEFGGREESIVTLHENWKKKVESYRDRLLQEEEKMRELDPLRPKSKDDDEMTGTFKQLNMD